jgi:cytochrome c-type biogenesis protein CcmH/NrfG
MDLKRLSMAERITSLAAVLLLLDLLVLPWHRISIGIGAFGFTSSRTGLESPNGFLGLLAAIVAIAVVARIMLAKFSSVALPALPVSDRQLDLIGGAVLVGLVLLKIVLETSYLSVGAWLAVPLSGAALYGGYLRSREPASATRPEDTAAGLI